MGTAIGKISSSPDGEDVIVEWTIPNFFSLSKKDGAYYWSPKFSFGGEEWYLRISPNGQSKRDSHNHVDLHLYKYSSGTSIRQTCSLSLKTLKGEKQYEKHGTKVFDGFGERYEFNRFISRSEISNRMSELVPGGDLTVVCKMKKTTSAGSASKSL